MQRFKQEVPPCVVMASKFNVEKYGSIKQVFDRMPTKAS
jgi:hypothetical protein